MQEGSGRIPMQRRCVPKKSCPTHNRNSANARNIPSASFIVPREDEQVIHFNPVAANRHNTHAIY
jgi:hypothetical protein